MHCAVSSKLRMLSGTPALKEGKLCIDQVTWGHSRCSTRLSRIIETSLQFQSTTLLPGRTAGRCYSNMLVLYFGGFVYCCFVFLFVIIYSFPFISVLCSITIILILEVEHRFKTRQLYIQTHSSYDSMYNTVQGQAMQNWSMESDGIMNSQAYPRMHWQLIASGRKESQFSLRLLPLTGWPQVLGGRPHIQEYMENTSWTCWERERENKKLVG